MTNPIRSYLAECFWPGVTQTELDELDARVRRIARRAPEVRYLGSMLTLQDEVVFCFFEGYSVLAVEQAARLAGVPFARIVESTGLPAHRGAQAMKQKGGSHVGN